MIQVEEEIQPMSPPPIPKKTNTLSSSLEQDKELMKIFERTYGSAKQEVHTIFQPAQRESFATLDAYHKDQFNQPEYLLVDGYNIIFGWDSLKTIARDNLDAARQKLIHRLSNYQGYKQCNLILVFDAYKVKGNLGDVEKTNNISVVYTKEAETADMYIEKVTHNIAKKYRVRVATSDGLEQLIIMGHGAERVSALMFEDEVEQVEKNIQEYIISQK